MIFVTIGTQEPFDRLIKAVDEFSSHWKGEKVIAQAGVSHYKAKNIEIREFLTPSEYEEIFASARLVISHAGTGTILSALIKLKPLLVMPRKASLGEHRNEHQLATAKRFASLGYIRYVNDGSELKDALEATDDYQIFMPDKTIGIDASASLVKSMREFMFD